MCTWKAVADGCDEEVLILVIMETQKLVQVFVWQRQFVSVIKRLAAKTAWVKDMWKSVMLMLRMPPLVQMQEPAVQCLMTLCFAQAYESHQAMPCTDVQVTAMRILMTLYTDVKVVLAMLMLMTPCTDARVLPATLSLMTQRLAHM